MKTRRLSVCSIILLMLLGTGNLKGQQYDPAIDSILNLYNEAWLKVQCDHPEDVARLSRFTSVASLHHGVALVNVNREEFAILLNQGFQYEHHIVERPVGNQMAATFETLTGWNTYPTYLLYDSLMFAFAQNYPGLCSTSSFLTLQSGRRLLLLRLTSSVHPSGTKPLFLYSSTMHGNETAGYIMMLRLADTLLKGYGSDPEATWLLDNMEILICPLANPDGTYYGGNHTVNGAIRRNSNNVDLNRNYPDPRTGPHPDGNSWQPETVAFMNLADSLQFTMGANLHGGAEVVNYPWDTWTHFHPDNNWWIRVSRAYADTVHFHAPAGFFTDLNNGITNGAAWYVITGGRQDYMNYFARCREVTLELSYAMILPTGQLNAMWGYHHRSLINYMKEGFYGLRGMVTDSVTGLPLKARIWINNHDADSSHVFTNTSGYYFRPVFPGTYLVTYSANGYHSQTRNVSVYSSDTTIADVALVPVDISIPGMDADSEVHVWYHAESRILRLEPGDQQISFLALYSLDGRLQYQRKNPGSEVSLALVPGVYLIAFRTTTEGWGRRRIVIY